MEYFKDLISKIGLFFTNNGLSIIASILVLIIGIFLVHYFCKLLLRIIYATKIDNAVGSFIVTLLKIILYVVIIFSCASILGISGNNFLVALSSVALAVALALKDSLSNLANGIIIIATKPFKKGDHVQIGSVEGNIRNIKLFTTEIYSVDNKKIIIPNSNVVSTAIINFTANPTRRLDLTFSISYNSDLDKVKEVMLRTINEESLVLKTPEATILFLAMADSSINLQAKMWVNTENYWKVYDRMNLAMFKAFQKENIEIPFNQLDVNLRNTGGK